MTTNVILQDQDSWAPLIGVEVQAIDADTGGILDRQTTDKAGYANFDEGDFDTTRYFFRPLITRDRLHMIVVPPFGWELYGIDASEQYVDGRDGWEVKQTGAPDNINGHGMRTAKNGTMFHVNWEGIGDAGSLYRSSDDGVSWQVVTPPISGLTCFSVDITPTDKVWALWSGSDISRLYWTGDYGDTWTLDDTIAGAGFVHWPLMIGIDPENSSRGGMTRIRGGGSGCKFFLYNNGVWPANDAGGVDVSTDANPGVTDGQMLFTQGAIIVATSRGTGGSERARLHRSTNGSTWATVFESAENIDWAQLAYAKPGILFAAYAQTGGTASTGLIRSSDAGLTWDVIDLPEAFTPRGILYDHLVDKLYVIRSATAVYRLKSATRVSAPATVDDWETLPSVPTAGFQNNRYQDVTLVPPH